VTIFWVPLVWSGLGLALALACLPHFTSLSLPQSCLALSSPSPAHLLLFSSSAAHFLYLAAASSSSSFPSRSNVHTAHDILPLIISRCSCLGLFRKTHITHNPPRLPCSRLVCPRLFFSLFSSLPPASHYARNPTCRIPGCQKYHLSGPVLILDRHILTLAVFPPRSSSSIVYTGACSSLPRWLVSLSRTQLSSKSQGGDYRWL
jgi:hypothetical protein